MNNRWIIVGLAAVVALSGIGDTNCFAGKRQKWEDLAEAVRKTIRIA